MPLTTVPSRSESVACDSSVLVAALAAWHPRHRDAHDAVRRSVGAVPAHVYLETYSVLTRLPAPFQQRSQVVASALGGLRKSLLVLEADDYRQLLAQAAIHHVSGGSIYDALVGFTALHHRARLVTMDARARATYDAVGVRYELL